MQQVELVGSNGGFYATATIPTFPVGKPSILVIEYEDRYFLLDGSNPHPNDPIYKEVPGYKVT